MQGMFNILSPSLSFSLLPQFYVQKYHESASFLADLPDPISFDMIYFIVCLTGVLP